MTKSEIRQRAEYLIEQLIALIDDIDGDADFELEPDLELETDIDLNPISLQSVDRVPAKRITMRRAA